MSKPGVSQEYIQRFRATHSADDTDSQVNDVAVATLAAPVAGWRNSALKADASYSDATVVGILQIKSGAVVIAEKHIAGAGAIDFDPEIGRPAEGLAEAMTAELSAGGAGVTGKVYFQGFAFRDN